MVMQTEFINALIDFILDQSQSDASYLSSPLDLLSLILRGTITKGIQDKGLYSPTSLF